MGKWSLALRFLYILLLAFGHLFCLGFGPARLSARDFDELALWPRQVRQLGRLGDLEVGAVAALLLDVDSQTVLYQKDATSRVAPASTTKMMTALVALQRGNLDDTVVVQVGDLAVWSAIGLTAGERWSLGDLLYALMLPSDNVVALIIARHIAGSEAAFVEMMNAQAAEWGLRDTRFVNPHGLDHDQHYSTAHDLAQIAARGLAHPRFAEIISTREHKVAARTLRNTNELLGAYDGAAGVKTGTTDRAGQCLVSVVRRPDGRALAVVLGSADRYRDSHLLLYYYFANYVTVPLGLGVKGVNLLHLPDGASGVLALREPGRAFLPRWRLPWLRVQRFYDEGALVPGDSPVGVVRFIAGRDKLAELPLWLLAP